jgi:SPP1 family predicted phage head-tail adaptor
MTYRVLDAGALDKRVTIQARNESDDGGGGQTIAWTDVAIVWASVAPGTGREFTLAQQLQPELSHVVACGTVRA